MLSEIIYTSRAVKPMRSAGLERLVQQSRSANQRKEITGMLFYQDQQFLQLIEGVPEAVADLYAKIQRDRRHIGVKTVAFREKERRCFDAWSMGYSNFDNYQVDFEDQSAQVEFDFPGQSLIAQMHDRIRSANAISLFRHFARFCN